MEKRFSELQSLKIPIEESTKQLFRDSLGYELNRVECRILESRDLIVNIERKDSATERFLLTQNRADLALEIGSTINRILKERLTLTLIDKFGLSIAEIS